MENPLLLTLAILLTVALYVWTAASLHAMFRKAGEEGWQAWVPVLNTIVLLRLGGFSGWWVVLAFVPLVNVVFVVILVMAYYRISRAFGFGAGMTVLAFLLLPVWSSILGWGSARWLGAAHAAGHAHGPVRRGDALDARILGRSGDSYVPLLPESAQAPQPPASVAPASPAPAPLSSPAPQGEASAPPVSVPPGSAPEQSGPIDSVPFAPAAAPHSALDWWSEAEASVQEEPVERVRAPFTGSISIPRSDAREEPVAPAAPRRAVVPGAEGPGAGEWDAPASETTAGGPFAPPPAAPPVAAVDPWAPPAPVTTPIPAAAMRALRSSSPAPDADASFETSGEVSAVAGAPRLGEPKSALASVSAVQQGAAFPEPESEPEEEFDETILAFRRRATWTLTRPLGVPVKVASDVLIIGRRPSADPDFPTAQLVPVADETRTMSKTHARLELHGGSWLVVDLDSTNGVILVREDGSEVDATPGVPERLVERFFLGDAELRLAQDSLAT